MRGLVFAALLSGCANQGDELRIVNSVTWHELPALELHDRCRNYAAGLRGCVISAPEGDHIYTLPVVR